MQPKTFSHPELVKNLPQEVKKLFAVFNDEILLVGGSVRDLILGKKLNDFDFATKFLPEKITEILEKNNIKAVPTGARFGTITAVVNGKNFEITTLRKDTETDGRHLVPEFVDDFYEDAARRDFTINALYLDSEGSLHDYFGGLEDLKNKKLHFIGNADERITEDFLRILRFFRLSCEYAKELDSSGLQACIKQKENLKKLSRERIRAEFLKLLASTKTQNLITILEVMKSQKISAEIFSSELDIESFKRLLEIKKDADLKLKIAVLFLHKNIDLKIFSQEICATNFEKKYLQALSTLPRDLDLASVKELLAFEEKELIEDFYIFCLAKKIGGDLKVLKFIEEFSLQKFPLSGSDVSKLGFKDKGLGEALNKAKRFWAESDFSADKKTLLDFLKK